jgi:4-hydroxybenzoate polyprenyltransferase
MEPATQTGTAALPRRSAVGGLLRSLRPSQWIKNSVIFAALIFAHRFAEGQALARSTYAFLLFCAVSSAVYIINDLLDVEADRAHPTKRLRPIAAAQVSPALASAFAALLVAGALGGAALLSRPFCAVAGTYFLLNLAYSTWLKRVVIVDVMVIASGFLLRAVAGAVVLEVEISHWLVLCASLLSLFLGFCKRRNELAILADRAADHRSILSEYSFPFLDQMISVVTASTLVAYCFYTLSPEVEAKLGTRYLPLTIPFVLYGIFRYLYLVYRRDEGGNPTRTFYTDRPLLVDVALWALTALVVLERSGR